MEVFGKEPLTVVIFIVSAIVGFCLKTKILQLFSWILTKSAPKINISEEDVQRDIAEMKRTTDQIIQNWIGVTKLVSQIQSDQNDFISHLPNLLDEKINETLKQALEEVFLRYEQRNVEMRQNMQEDIQTLKTLLGALEQKFVNGEEEVTIGEMRQQKEKNACTIEQDTSKMTATMKECLTDILKDAKLHFSVDREEENRELEIILTKLAEDREDIKKTFLQAFCIAAEQAKKNYDQFGEIGEEGLKYMAVVNNLLHLKLDETDDVLKNVVGVVTHQKVDIDAMKNVLENMDGQFSELHEKLAQIYQVNIEHCEEIALNLENTSNNWVQSVEKIEKTVKQLSDDTNHVKQMFKEIKDSSQKMRDDGIEDKNETTHCDSTDSSALTQKQENMIFVYSCWEKMKKTSCTVEGECHSICELILGLEQKLLSLNESVEKLDEFIRGLNLEVVADSMNYDDAAAEIVQTDQGQAGDGESQVVYSIANRWKNVPQLNRRQNIAAISNAMRYADIILRNLCGRADQRDGENFMQSKPVDASAADDKQLSQSSTEQQVHKVETVKTRQKNN